MKEIQINELHEIMLNILEAFHIFCVKNNIKYTLIGGSLIGAIRHKGFIPWDDDIDVIMTKDNYEKFINNYKHDRYKILEEADGGNRFMFTKIIDTQTRIIEPNLTKNPKSYGVYLDVFCYYKAPANKKEQVKYCRKIQLLVSLFSRKRISKNESLKQNFLRINKNIISVIIGYRRLNNIKTRLLNKYSTTDSDYLISNWPLYGTEKEIQKKSNFTEYKIVPFETKKAMITTKYDEVLKTTFGNYMELPPKNQRTPKHDIKAWWKNEK